MSSAFPEQPRAPRPWTLLLLGLLAWSLAGTACADAPRRVIRISADPNNLPFTNEKLEGFENRIAELIGRELNAEIRYIWRAQRRGFFRHALKEGECDLVLAVPAGLEMALTTRPYYRSTYVFAWRKQDGPRVTSLDDPVLKSVKVGVQMVGDDGANSPPVHALGRRGIIRNLIGYTVYGDYTQPNPPARVMEGLAKGEVDVVMAWGPLAGYFAGRQSVPIELAPVSPARDDVLKLPFTFAIAMGVRRDDPALRDELNILLDRKKAEIDRILDEYGVPRVEAPAGATGASAPKKDEDRGASR